MLDVTLVSKKAADVHCVYIPDAILSICRMLLLLTNAVKVHCVYMPDASLFTCQMSCSLNKCIESALCLYAGYHSVYMPDVLFVF